MIYRAWLPFLCSLGPLPSFPPLLSKFPSISLRVALSPSLLSLLAQPSAPPFTHTSPSLRPFPPSPHPPHHTLSLTNPTNTFFFPKKGLPTFTAKFNARTGQFTRPDARQPGHLSEYDRARRMSEFYFDVAAWEGELAKRGGSLMAEEDGGQGQGSNGDGLGGEGGKKRKRPTQKDLVRFSFFYQCERRG